MTEELTSLLQPVCLVFHPVFTEIPSPTQGIPVSEASVTGVAEQHWTLPEHGKECRPWFVGDPLSHPL